MEYDGEDSEFHFNYDDLGKAAWEYNLLAMGPGAHFYNISWPSLYPPAIEVGFLGPPTRPGGYYLLNPGDIFTFTLYWTLIFHLPFSFIAGLYAFFNFLFPPVRIIRDPIVLVAPPRHAHVHSRSRSHSFSLGHSRSYSRPHSQPDADPPPNPNPNADPLASASPPDWPKPRVNARRSRLVFALLVLFSFLSVSLLTAVASAAVLACVIVGVYSAGGMYVSTWIPFVWAVIQGLVALLGVWPTVVDII